jgi:hypothetical protein
VAESRNSPLELGDGAVDRGQVLSRAGRQRAVELGQRARGRQLSGALDRGALELATQVALELPDPVGVERLRVTVVTAAAGLQPEGTPDALHVDADHARALAPPAEGGHREPGEVAHLAVVALDDRPADRLAQLVQVDAVARALEALVLDPAVERLGLGRPEEVAVEEQLEDPPVLLRLGDRRGEGLAEVALVRPAHLVEGGEGVEDLGGADGDTLGAEVLEEGEEASRGRGHRLRPRA